MNPETQYFIILWFIADLLKVFYVALWHSKCLHEVNWTCNVRKVSIWKCELPSDDEEGKNIFIGNSLPLRHREMKFYELWSDARARECLLFNGSEIANLNLRTSRRSAIAFEGGNLVTSDRFLSHLLSLPSRAGTFRWNPRHSDFFNYVFQIEFLSAFIPLPSRRLFRTKTT